MGLLSWAVAKAKKFYLNYSMVTSLYMMEPTEVVIISKSHHNKISIRF